MDTQKIIHILRNPYGWSQKNKDSARLAAADEIEKWRDAYKNMRKFAEDNGLDTMAYNNSLKATSLPDRECKQGANGREAS